MHSLEQLRTQTEEIEEKVGYLFEKKELLYAALTHRSYVNEHREQSIGHNERLEFLGDSVLGLVMADLLYHRLPDESEGFLSSVRSRLVDSSACAAYFQKLGLSPFLLLGRGEQMSEGRQKQSILADAFEGLVGALFLDGGLAAARSFLLCHFEEEVKAAIGSPSRNYKAELQDFSQRKFHQVPVYKVVEESGPEHAKSFHVLVFLNDEEVGKGQGSSKKEAEQRAAYDAVVRLRLNE